MDFIRSVSGFVDKENRSPVKEEQAVQGLCKKALDVISQVNLSTQRGEKQHIPEDISDQFSGLVREIEKKRVAPKMIYSLLVKPILDQIYIDNRNDLRKGLNELSPNEQAENLSKIEMFAKRGFKALTALRGLMNANNDKSVRKPANNKELSALSYLVKVRREATNGRVSRRTFLQEGSSVRRKLF